ncbi:MAG: hypothetical protein IJT68_04370 [Lentisphaeria bacterium]|nr:hypothetical protein [Lentisphaeria bacterium]
MKLGRFTFSFAEITDQMSTKIGFREGGTRFQNTIYTLLQENQAGFSPFFGQIITMWERKDAPRPRFAWGGFAASVNSFARVRQIMLPRDAKVRAFLI